MAASNPILVMQASATVSRMATQNRRLLSSGQAAIAKYVEKTECSMGLLVNGRAAAAEGSVLVPSDAENYALSLPSGPMPLRFEPNAPISVRLDNGTLILSGRPNLGAAATLQGLSVIGVPHAMAVMVTTVGAESPYYCIRYTIYRS
ncbi:hypothetical protein L7H23_10935 [Sphingopyxis sp. BSN-002]|uniref:hypothetical protein n=1 Tax=Sphingopyxis sp. BSN-002 TaxID=2911495 RepID=UPI001EDB9B69|nr:hypothetical protein [Sphingopyxis sp. BSN-002]UKK83083.1 hypothetical protein L7H23_10935 [Sphingopyxis sp. BSN-002]